MKQKLDIQTWVRKDHFEFFNQFEEPFHGVCVQLDCTKAYRYTKTNNLPFHLYCLHSALTAAHQVEAFKYCIEGEDVFIYSRINGGTTIARPNGTFGFAYFNYYPSLTEFLAEANIEVERIKARTDLVRSPDTNVIRFSTLPWIDFTSLSHARMFSHKDSCPKISFGKMTETNGKRTMPMSIHVHHALVDGLHVSQFIDGLQELLDRE